MGTTLEQKLIERIFAVPKRDVLKVINSKPDLEAVRIWHEYGKSSSKPESKWLDRQGQSQDFNVLGALCLLFGVWGKRGFKFARAVDILKSGLEGSEPSDVLSALRHHLPDDSPSVQTPSVNGPDLIERRSTMHRHD